LYDNTVAGGKVAENANLDLPIHPGWRKAKNHVGALFFKFSGD
jgi:hypothetical protein